MGGNRKPLNISKNGGLTTHTKRYLPLTHQLCEQAAIAAFEDKWFRKNYLADAQKYGGVAYGRLKAETAKNEMHAKLEAVHGIALEMEQRVLDLMDGTADDLRKTGRIPLYRSYRLISYNGYFVGTKTSGAAAELEQRHLFKAAKWAVGAATRLREVKAG